MTTRWRAVASAVVAGLAVLATPAVAGAALAISVPSTVNLGTVPTGSATFSAKLGTVTVSASGLVAPSFTATVATTTFTTGSRSTAETVPKGSISYWPGPLTASTGLQNALPGQLTALQKQPLSGAVTAFSSGGLVLSITTSWNPTLVFSLLPSQVAGAYTGTITHSVA